MDSRLWNFTSRHRNICAVLAVIVLTVIFHAGTFCGVDSDFQGYALRSRLVFLGKTPYLDFFDHKPPLYYFVLLPGNFLGGLLISFFLVHLAYLSILSLLLFHYGRKIFSGQSLTPGFISVLLFLCLTALQFFCYGNLNAGIVYVVIIFNILAFFKIFEFFSNKNLSFKMQLQKIVFIGLLSGCSFLTRFSLTPLLLVVSLIIFLLLLKRITLANMIKLGVVYSTAFLLPTITFLLIYRPPLDILYDQLIKFNYFYSHSDQILSFIYAIPTTFIAFLKYSTLPIIISLTGLIIYTRRNVSIPFFRLTTSIITVVLAIGLAYFLIHESSQPKFFGRYSIRGLIIINVLIVSFGLTLFLTIFPINKIMGAICSRSTKQKSTRALIFWLLLYLALELLSVVFQKKGFSYYPFFPAFIPIIFLATLSLTYLLSFFRTPKRVYSIFTILFYSLALIVFFRHVYVYKGNLCSCLKWPEKTLIKRIKTLAKRPDDLFTIDYQPYIYLETHTIPPIERHYYVHSKWSIYGTKPQLEKELHHKLFNHAPALLTTHVQNHPPQIENFLSRYEKIGIFNTTYRPHVVNLYLRKDLVETLEFRENGALGTYRNR